MMKRTVSPSFIRSMASASCFYSSNKVLLPSVINFSRSGTEFKLQFIPNYRLPGSRPIVTDTAHVLEQVGRKALTCQPSDSVCQQKDSKDFHDRQALPFTVKPKEKGTKPARVLSTKDYIRAYVALTKPNLTFLVMLSSISTYALTPNSAGIAELVFLSIGTMLCSGAANAINMGREPNYDKMMVRTSARPVVRGIVSPKEAFTFAGITGTIGTAILYFGVNPTVAGLGFLNIVLYSWIYTSLKRKSILNTWVGAIVGAIPPLMGWAVSSSLADPGAWCLAALLYAWQFPHFNSLSHNIRSEYKRAGYVMTAFENPKLNARVALRYSFLMFPICFGLAYFNVTDPYFVLDSSLLNGWMSYWTFKFWLQQASNYSRKTLAAGGASQAAVELANGYARKAFWCSVWHLPGILVLAMLHKKGQWDRFFS
ncbi:Heme A:farnesyltransferase [Komagataella phaffii CBS 7435]|uniref:Protoheme IX farnesyltransferase, mitochondrial n=2 Tax=Komagataella phaffii TaxID=460519 RepID=C4QVI5_KOMPG|nr:Heme A:farnesyltransferase [Komagataella phaffii GS115]CAH2445914.1 Heme Afarnesyltransferase [Komagataella phaffii CBS 7435]CAY67258.1 Heme A:farnesyltransferase [Komagataella phaffii GS115]SCV11774.1 Heme A:farnesyltransferase [Komagataella phaffii CBS 7435]